MPAAWTDVDRRRWERDDELVGPALSASTDLDAFVAGWSVPGMFIGVSDELPFADAEELLSTYSFGDACDFVETLDYFDSLYTGFADVYVNCGPERSVFVQIVAAPEDGSSLVAVQLLAPTERDLDAAFTVIESLTARPG